MSIQVKGISKNIQHRPIITDITFDWQPGRIVGLVGRNGAGKTTLFRTLAAHYLPDAGQLIIDDQNVDQKPLARQNLFYIDTQNNFFSNQTLKQLGDTYALGYPDFDVNRLQTLLSEEKLTPTSRYRQLSKGQRMLFQILLALASGTPYIILDEPFDGLDILVRERIVARIVDAVSDQQTSFLISSHNLTELDGLCDQVLLLKDQQLVANYDLEQFRTQARKLQLVFPTKTLPAVVKDAGHLVKVYGRVLEVYFDHYTDDVDAALKAAKPVMMEPCPLTITDLFRVKLGDQAAVMVGD
ncbi:ATP-binding cassette domain-containing protein [Lactiplantibacillus mudanjiangensis]|uniref:Multidrug ABC transporter [Lactobacillus pentosus] n=1 Tax=Lactiplantibacillus mudanjiangensis TaxID=1296538 RepID=A0A660E6P9_9LACO|nr:ABC transporter ATP-binding protein [Lactiplantibacillus mudanjiangensis]VDG23370.1 multidrug ABC transporter [Lactobacillus pentosus] [Lactiplantibacillus mudanjiangensis]VDG28747.1 multidrug ABC transporter [Lactobacillus pentosus] [Lactiplantibacillus mudanjiangensis]